MPLRRSHKRQKGEKELSQPPPRTYKRWPPGEKERLVALYTNRPPGQTLAQFTEIHASDSTPKKVGQVIYEMNRKARNEKESSRTSPTTTAGSSITTASTDFSSVTTATRASSSFNSSRKSRKRTVFEFSDEDDESEEEDNSSADERTPNKCIKLTLHKGPQAFLDKPQDPQDRSLSVEHPLGLDKATPMSSPILARSEPMPSTRQIRSNLDPRKNRQNNTSGVPNTTNLPPPSPSASHPSPSAPPPPPPPPPETIQSPIPQPPPSLPVATVPSQLTPSPHYSPPPPQAKPNESQIPSNRLTQQTVVENGHERQPTDQGKITCLRQRIAQESADFHLNRQKLFDLNLQHSTNLSQAVEELFSLLHEYQAKNSRLTNTLTDLQKQVEELQHDRNRLQDTINNQRSERALYIKAKEAIDQLCASQGVIQSN